MARPYRLYDMHCHLSALEDAEAVAAEAAERGMAVLDVTVDPRSARGSARLEGHPNVARACGMHPWWVARSGADGAQIELAAELCARSRFVGEVGIDRSDRLAESHGAQARAFARIVDACARTPVPGRLFSLHAVLSAGTVLDILQERGMMRSAACIFHWFSGTSDEFVRARDAGCLFSVNPRMLETRRGREYARQAPLDRLLLETDAPSPLDSPLTAAQLESMLEGALDALARIRGEGRAQIAARIADTSAGLLSR